MKLELCISKNAGEDSHLSNAREGSFFGLSGCILTLCYSLNDQRAEMVRCVNGPVLIHTLWRLNSKPDNPIHLAPV
jgi:hypothetical protein